LSVYQADAQVFDVNSAVEISTDFNRSQGRLTISSWNKDFCDYYLHLFFIDTEGFEGLSPEGTTSATVGTGRRQIRIYRARTESPRYRFYYVMYRGDCNKKPNTDFIYALPVAANKAVTTRIVGTPERPQRFFDLPSDTVYACRSGVMCDDNLNSSRRHANVLQITLYHADGSFGEYVFEGKPLVAPGKRIKMGDPIAVVKKTDGYSVRFLVYFLDKNKLMNHNPGDKYAYLQPFFQTSNEGKVHLENDITYLCEYTDELLMQEMGKLAKKKLLKDISKK
jgi:hypothetical protein